MLSDELDADILVAWRVPNEEDIQKFIEVGQAWALRLEHPRPHLGTVGGHLYSGGQNPPPTVADIAEVRSELNALWRFERTIYENRNGQNPPPGLQRIIHLFAHVDAYNVVVDMFALHSLKLVADALDSVWRSRSKARTAKLTSNELSATSTRCIVD
jgi:hypothetical protein